MKTNDWPEDYPVYITSNGKECGGKGIHVVLIEAQTDITILDHGLAGSIKTKMIDILWTHILFLGYVQASYR